MIESKQPHFTTPQSGVRNFRTLRSLCNFPSWNSATMEGKQLAWWPLFQVFHSKLFSFWQPSTTCKVLVVPLPSHSGTWRFRGIPYGRLNIYMSCHPGVTIACILWRGDNLVVVALQFHRATTHVSFLVGGWEPQPIWKICGSYNGSFPRVNRTYLKPPPNCL